MLILCLYPFRLSFSHFASIIADYSSTFGTILTREELIIPGTTGTSLIREEQIIQGTPGASLIREEQIIQGTPGTSSACK